MARIRIGIYLGEDGPKLGRGKIRLLKAIRDEGSISGAARAMGMAYRHAWTLVDELNRCFADPVVDASVGGREGGGARLTDWGEELVERFDEMERSAGRAIAAPLAALERKVAAVGSGRRRKE